MFPLGLEMVRGAWVWMIVATMAAASWGCPESAPLKELKTVTDYCDRACTAPAIGPCEGLGTSATCRDDCAKNASGHDDACDICLASRSGWQWSTCDCDPACNFATDPACLPAAKPCVVCFVTTTSGRTCSRQPSCTVPPTCFGQYTATPGPAAAGDGGPAPAPPDCAAECRGG